MKLVYTILLLLVVAFVATDVFRVATLWNDYRIQDIVVHSTFAFGAFVIVGFNSYFMLVGTPTSISAHVKLLLSFISQVVVLGFFSLLIIGVWKGYLFEKSSPNAVWSNLGSICFLLFLLSLLVVLLFWSKRQFMPNPSFKRDA
ncbi:MAG: hypothetical protein CTY14_01095 [Methylotenera sp.]|nr:MAG: hypothetical protein CTY14_01095 [Methylotenera sp.]